jgi:hypothetical protein
VTVEVRALAQRIVTNPAYQRRLHRRLLAGTAPQLEALLWQYAFGKPREHTESRVEIVNQMAGLTLKEAARLAELEAAVERGEAAPLELYRAIGGVFEAERNAAERGQSP